MRKDKEVYTKCDWCAKDIAYGNASVSINRNVEQVDSTEEDPEGVVNVIDSSVVLTLCAQCGNRLDSDMLKNMILALTHGGLLSRKPETGREFHQLKSRDLN